MPISETLFEDAFQSYFDNADYDAPANVAKCRAFIAACRKLLAFPSRASQNSVDSEFNKTVIAGELQRARQWLALHAEGASGSSGGVLRFNLEDRA
jgi:hypothetical protein